MEYFSNVSEHWLEIVTAVYLISMVLYGHHKGFIRLAVSAAALLITLAAVRYAHPFMIEWLKQETPVYETMKESMVEHIGIDELLDKIGSDTVIQKEDEWMIIETLPIPEQMKQLLVENNNIEVYKMMGVEFFRDYVAGYLADMILKAAVFVVLFFIIYIILQVGVTWLDLIARLPILSGINKMAGALLGAVQAMIFIWILCLVFTVLSGTEIGGMVLAQISASPWLSWIYNHNMLSYLILGLIRSVW